MVWAVVAMQAAMILTLAVTPSDPPKHSRLMQLIWAWMHKPTFYPLIVLILGGPVLSILAWRVPGRHRRILITAWVVFTTIVVVGFGERVKVMLHVLWWQSTGS